MKKIIIFGTVTAVTFIAWEIFNLLSSSPDWVYFPNIFERYNAFKVDSISYIDGDWRFKKQILANYPNVEYMYASFLRRWEWNLMHIFPYRMRIKNGIMQSYGFYPLSKYPEFDESEYYSFFPIAPIKDYWICSDSDFLKKYCDEKISPSFENEDFTMDILRKDGNEKKLYALMRGNRFATTRNPKEPPEIMREYKKKYGREDYYYSNLWYVSMQKFACHVPSEKDAIIFYDELKRVDTAKVEILSMATENLSEIPEILATCKSLKKLFMPFNGVKFSASDMEILSSLENLEVLDIRYTDIANSPDPDLTGLRKLKNLKKVYIAGKYFAKDGNVPAVFADMPWLEILSITNAYDVKFPTIYDSGLSPKKIIVAYSKISQAVYKNLLKRSEKNCDKKTLVYGCRIMESRQWIDGEAIIWE